jgi:circadian clock protein KaiC
MKLRALIAEHEPRCMAIDPLSAIIKAGGDVAAMSVAERLLGLVKSRGITLLLTSLLAGSSPETEETPLAISTIADTWIHLSYVVRAGERNRALTIVKSRGTAHSNQVRELILSHKGVTLTDVYAAGGEVLMGTLRWEKEEEKRATRAEEEALLRRRKKELALAEAEAKARIQAIQGEIEALRYEAEQLDREDESLEALRDETEQDIRLLRHGDLHTLDVDNERPDSDPPLADRGGEAE